MNNYLFKTSDTRKTMCTSPQLSYSKQTNFLHIIPVSRVPPQKILERLHRKTSTIPLDINCVFAVFEKRWFRRFFPSGRWVTAVGIPRQFCGKKAMFGKINIARRHRQPRKRWADTRYVLPWKKTIHHQELGNARLRLFGEIQGGMNFLEILIGGGEKCNKYEDFSEQFFRNHHFVQGGSKLDSRKYYNDPLAAASDTFFKIWSALGFTRFFTSVHFINFTNFAIFFL